MSALLDGAIHPLVVPTHAIALLALGLLIGQRRAGPLPLMAFTAGLAGGLGAIVAAVGETNAPDILLGLTGVGASLVLVGRPLPRIVPVALAAMVGAALGLDSPPELLSIAAAVTILVGTWIGASATVTLVAIGTGRLTRTWQQIGLRIAGSWIAASAMLVLALRYARGLMF